MEKQKKTGFTCHHTTPNHTTTPQRQNTLQAHPTTHRIILQTPKNRTTTP
jgi:hypothetical protein